MRVQAFLADPDTTEATIVLTMPLKAWKEVRDELKTNETGPWHLRRAITDLVAQMQQRFYVKAEDDEPKG